MEIRFLGTGAAEGAPAIFCNCDTCKELRRRGEYYTRAQYLIDGVLGIDFPADAYYHALRFDLDLSAMRYLIVTHSHIDHFYPQDFILRGYKYADKERQPLTVYGSHEVLEIFREGTRREIKQSVQKNFTLVEIFPFQPFTCGEYRVTPLLANHGALENPFVYLVEKGEKRYLHLTDTGRLPRATLDYLEDYGKPFDLVTFDCTFLNGVGGANARHMGLEDNRAMQEEFSRRGLVNEKTKYAITHYSHNSAPLKENLQAAGEKYGYIPAYDGMRVNI